MNCAYTISTRHCAMQCTRACGALRMGGDDTCRHGHCCRVRRSGDTLLQRSKGYDDSRACQVFDTESAPRQRAKGMTIRISAGQR